MPSFRIGAAGGVFARCLLLVAFAILQGCASVNVVEDPSKSPPRPGESVVALSITGNTAQVTAMDEITVRRTDIPAGSNVQVLYTLRQVAPGLSRDTAMFVGVMPAGQYELSRFTNQQTRRFLALSDGMRANIGGFAVKDGRPVDLGRLIVTPVNEKVVVGRSSGVSSNLPLLKHFSPQHARFFEGEVASGWMAGRNRDDQVEAYALLRPVGADNPVQLPDGSVVAASRLGSLLVRSPAGRWTRIGSDVRESLLSVLPVQRPDARLLAVGELGTMMRLAPGADRLTPVDAGNLPPGNLLFIDGDDRFGWYLALQRRTDVTLFHSNQLEAGDWKPLRTESIGFDFWSGANKLWIWRRPGGLGYAVSAGTFNYLDYATGTWTTVKSPKDSRLLDVAPNDYGTMGILTSPGGGLGGVFAGLYISGDQGRTWQEIKSEFNVKVAPPRRLKSGALVQPGGVFSKPELYASADEGRTWQRRSDFRLDRRLVTLPSGDLLAIDLGQFGVFSISHSSDEGATWKTEYSNFDRGAYEAQHK